MAARKRTLRYPILHLLALLPCLLSVACGTETEFDDGFYSPSALTRDKIPLNVAVIYQPTAFDKHPGDTSVLRANGRPSDYGLNGFYAVDCVGYVTVIEEPALVDAIRTGLAEDFRTVTVTDVPAHAAGADLLVNPGGYFSLSGDWSTGGDVTGVLKMKFLNSRDSSLVDQFEHTAYAPQSILYVLSDFPLFAMAAFSGWSLSPLQPLCLMYGAHEEKLRAEQTVRENLDAMHEEIRNSRAILALAAPSGS